MGQIVKRKKKGRSSKADMAKRSSSPAALSELELRRSSRRRNVRYNIDDDDYLEEDFEEEEEDEEEERRREKKLKFVLKLNQDEDDEEEEDEQSDGRKKRRINGCDEVDHDYDDREEEVDGYGEDEDDDAEMRGRKGKTQAQDSIPGTPSDPPPKVPMSDKKTLELILDKLQKKDTYGVYAEPVDPEELPDYHDVIVHPMDFSTVRKKLGNGSYSTIEQFESDVFLTCSNAMQYNAADTIYHKQARSIQELAKKKFEKLRIAVDRSEKDSTIEQKTKSNFLSKKQTKKPFYRTAQEPVGSDFSSGATLATAGDIQNSSVAIQANACERPSHTDVLVEGNSLHAEYNLEKTEELSSGKDLHSKLGRNSSTLNDSRRATYNTSNQPVVRSESIFSTFEAEIKQLVVVGLQAEFSYARSLARFAATLGPVAWKVASRMIEQALPTGCKFGRGWVEEYEPLPTPVLTFESHASKESALLTRLQCSANVRKDNATYNTPVLATDVRKEDVTYKTAVPAKPHSFNVPVSEVKSSSFAQSKNKVSKLIELNLPPTASQNSVDLIAEKKNLNKSKKAASKSGEMVSRNTKLVQDVPSKQMQNNVVVNGGLPNGKILSNFFNTRAIHPSADSVSTQMAKVAAYNSHAQEHGISDPVQLMRILAGRSQNQQHSSNQFPSDTAPAMPSIPSVRNDSNNAAATARGWMSVGLGGLKQATESSSSFSKGQISAESLYNPAREHPQISEKNSFPHIHAFAVPEPVLLMNEARFQNRAMVFPQRVTTDLSRFQLQPHWQGLSPRMQQRQKRDTLPPDLNIGFQSPGSPVKQSSSVLVDSQQPDLALQL